MSAPKFVQALPPKTSGGVTTQKMREWDEFVEALKKRPGVWALWKENSYQGNGQTLKDRGCEIAYRKSNGALSPGGYPKWDIYVRWPEDAA